MRRRDLGALRLLLWLMGTVAVASVAHVLVSATGHDRGFDPWTTVDVSGLEPGGTVQALLEGEPFAVRRLAPSDAVRLQRAEATRTEGARTFESSVVQVPVDGGTRFAFFTAHALAAPDGCTVSQVRAAAGQAPAYVDPCGGERFDALGRSLGDGHDLEPAALRLRGGELQVAPRGLLAQPDG